MAERDSKQALGMGSTTAAFVVDITGSITDMRQSLNLAVQEVRSLNQALQITKSLVGSIQFGSFSGGGGGGEADDYRGPGSTLVAANPRFTPPSTAPLALNAPGAGGSGGGGGFDYSRERPALPAPAGGGFTGGSGGGGGGFTGQYSLSDYINENKGAGVLFASNIVSGALKSPADMVEAQLLLQRAATFSGGAQQYSAKPFDASGSIGDVIRKMVGQGMANDDMDAIRALAAAQSIGITGPNVTQANAGMGSVTQGIAAVSNLVPGMGMEGGMRAFAGMQQPRNVNRLRGLGIRLRDEQGNLKPPSQIIEDIWQKICRDYSGAYGAGKKPSERELLIGLQPGNSMDSFLDQYFGNDPMAKQMIINGLLYKARGGGDINRLTPEQAQAAGFSTTAVNAFYGREAESTRGTLLYNSAGAAGYEAAARTLSAISGVLNTTLAGTIQLLTAANAFALTMLGAGDNALSKLIGAAVAGKKAGGGPVENGPLPYIVGEEGPELFVPETKGTIIPNNEMQNYAARSDLKNKLNINDLFRHHGGSVKDTGADMSKDEWAEAFITKLGAKPNAVNMDAVKTWMAWEGGHWGNTAGYNPLNTTLKLKGSTLMDGGPGRAHGVRHYTSWQQGMDASVQTLFGNLHKERGYDEIVQAIREGTDKKAIISAIGKSSWGTKFGRGVTHGMGSSSSDPNAAMLESLFGTEMMTQFKDLTAAMTALTAATGVALPNPTSTLSSLVGGGWGSAGGAGTLTATGVGSKTVVINVSGSQEVEKIVAKVKQELEKEGFLVKAGKG